MLGSSQSSTSLLALDDTSKTKGDYLENLVESFQTNWSSFKSEDDDYLLQSFNFHKEANNTVKNLIRSFITYMKKKCDSLIVECCDNDGDDIQTIQTRFTHFCAKNTINNAFL